jgi:hypothetical protein
MLGGMNGLSVREVRRMPRGSLERRLFFAGVIALVAALSGWILWLLAAVD